MCKINHILDSSSQQLCTWVDIGHFNEGYSPAHDCKVTSSRAMSPRKPYPLTASNTS